MIARIREFSLRQRVSVLFGTGAKFASSGAMGFDSAGLVQNFE